MLTHLANLHQHIKKPANNTHLIQTHFDVNSWIPGHLYWIQFNCTGVTNKLLIKDLMV